MEDNKSPVRTDKKFKYFFSPRGNSAGPIIVTAAEGLLMLPMRTANASG